MFYLGIDVSKAKLDCALLDPSTDKRKTKVVANSPAGHISLLDWLDRQCIADIHAIMEPTGGYHEQAALRLVDAGIPISLVNPGRLRKYAQGIGALSKTDTADSVVLARYGLSEKPAQWRPPSLSVRQLHVILRRHVAVAKDLHREKNRAKQTAMGETLSCVQRSIQESIAFHTKELETLQRQIDEHIEHDPELHAIRNLLLTIPGVGERLSDHLTPLLASHDFQHAEQLAAYLGLVPVSWESGSSVYKRPRLSKAGPRHLRKLFFFPAMVASRVNPHIEAQYKRLLARGKPKMLALGAAMHKLAHLCFGVVTSGKPYDPGWHSAQRNSASEAGAAPPC